MIFDVEETPTLNSLEINGILTFWNRTVDDLNITSFTIKSRRVYVRAGELRIGSEEQPYNYTAKIILVGNQDDVTFALSPTLDVYNKVLVNVGKLSIYGPERIGMSRLAEPVFKGDKEAYIGSGLSWLPGD